MIDKSLLSSLGDDGRVIAASTAERTIMQDLDDMRALDDAELAAVYGGMNKSELTILSKD
ncbi:hypothetical protein [Streptosporangium sp. NPDC002607]